jgi:hypothetical protein
MLQGNRGRLARSKAAKYKREQKPLSVDNSSEGKKDKDADFELEVRSKVES